MIKFIICIVLILVFTQKPIQLEEELVENEPPDILEEPKIELDWIAPCSTSSVKTYMDYRAITNTSSKQYKYIKKNMFPENGLLLDKDGYIGVALGSWWGKIGTKWIIRLDTGIELKVVKVEEKSNQHVNGGCQHKKDGSVIEFVIDKTTIPSNWWGKNGYVLNGNFNNNRLFKGKIVEVAKIP